MIRAHPEAGAERDSTLLRILFFVRIKGRAGHARGVHRRTTGKSAIRIALDVECDLFGIDLAFVQDVRFTEKGRSTMSTVKTLATLMVCCSAWAVTGCQTAPKANYRLERRKITVLSEPEGATVTQLYPFERGSKELGKTPLTRWVLVMTDVTFQRAPFSEAAELFTYADSVVLRVEKDGHEPYRTTVRTKPDDTAMRKCVLEPLSSQ